VKTIQGFATGIVRDNEDPEGTGRVRVEIPGVLVITPYWVMPLWPAQGVNRGSQYPPPEVGHPVMCIFEYGQYALPNSRAYYMAGYYGIDATGASAGPTVPAAAESADKARKYAVLWESSKLIAYVVDDPDNDDERIVLKAKTSGSKIEINAADGESGKAETITIEARTMLSLYAQGLIDIQSDTGVQIQGRRVRDLTTGDI